MFDENDILVFSNLNFNYVKDKVREMDSDGYESEYGSKYGLIVAGNLGNNYNITKGKKGYGVMKNGNIMETFKTKGEAMAYIKEQEEVDGFFGDSKYSFENPDEIDKDYLHLGTNDSASMAIIMNNKGMITTRYF